MRRVSKDSLLKLSARVQATLEYNPTNATFVREIGDKMWTRPSPMYSRLYARLRNVEKAHGCS
jgi:hypothetical protein